jgi:imidazolonepropionase-like amidohydrolase
MTFKKTNNTQMKQILIIYTSFFLTITGFAQSTFPINGVKDQRNQIYHAFTNVNLVINHHTTIQNGTLLIKDGIVEASGSKVVIPKGTIIHDLKGKWIYPSLIDLYSNYGMPEVNKEGRGRSGGPQMESSKKGAYYWNEAIKPETNASEIFNTSPKDAEEYRKLGFGLVLTHQLNGIARGTSALVSLADASENLNVINGQAAAHYSFSKGASTQDYPSSLMGSIALLRQAYLDAQWYKNLPATKKEYNISLEEWLKIQKLPQIFEVSDKLSALRADKIGDEFGVQYIIKGKGDEYQRIDDIKKTGASFIIPLNFPTVFDVEDPFDARLVSLEDMKNWELAPTNAAKLAQQNINFAFTLADLKERNDFWKNIRKAIQNGLSSQAALQALTETPAKMLNMENVTGSLKPGMLANFLITSDSLFADKNIIYENWVMGTPYKINDVSLADIRGEYTLNIGKNLMYKLKVAGEMMQPTAEIIISDSLKHKANISRNGDLLALSFNPLDKSNPGNIRLSGRINFKSAIWDGKGQIQNGTWVEWSAIKKGKSEPKAEKDTIPKLTPAIGNITYPLMAYGWNELPKQKTYIIQNATVWTNEADGILKNTSVLVKNGKIAAIGGGIDTAGATIIDGTGKHVTPGIIDEHSHIAISKGVNEGTQAVTAEVSIADVVNSDDINIYRQLAGGVTAAQLLHGSANPIGGQSALIKLRWGQTPEKMKIEGADGFIKFALGENVKQANWGDRYVIRFPQTRMGVEQVFYDAFIRAREYDQEWRAYQNLKSREKSNTFAPRKDLELEVLAQILNRKRFVTCHSYVQSEINMLMTVADSMKFTINTFTHILEGYKVADKMKAHGAGGSTFSDWWAYKHEVLDAIPQNASILQKMGITTAINSDDAEMGRRLNQEAAKSVKYGGMSQEEALKLVTLNPAKLLHLDKQMGSILVGKDADLVLWSGNPLSIYSKAEKTFVDGIIYFDLERDNLLKEEINAERTRLINKMIQAKKDGEKVQKPEMKKQLFWHCDTMGEEGNESHIHNHH